MLDTARSSEDYVGAVWCQSTNEAPIMMPLWREVRDSAPSVASSTRCGDVAPSVAPSTR
jgi:hypothetical protein